MFALPGEETLINTTKKLKRERITRVDAIYTSLNQHLTPEMARTISNASAKGASNWLNVLPLAEEGYVLNKEEFRDAMAMRYSKHILGLPSKCACGSNFDPVHALNCKKGGFIHSRHDQLRNLEAKMLSEVCQDIEIEPQLQPLTGENMSLESANTEDSARLDVKARGFYRQGQCAFFDIRVAHVNARSNRALSTDQILRRAESEKKRSYNQRVIEVEHGTFTPLIFGTNGAMGTECSAFHKILAKKIAQKTNKKYCEVMSSIRTKISFSLIRSTLLCLKGSRKY